MHALLQPRTLSCMSACMETSHIHTACMMWVIDMLAHAAPHQLREHALPAAVRVLSVLHSKKRLQYTGVRWMPCTCCQSMCTRPGAYLQSAACTDRKDYSCCIPGCMPGTVSFAAYLVCDFIREASPHNYVPRSAKLLIHLILDHLQCRREMCS